MYPDSYLAADDVLFKSLDSSLLSIDVDGEFENCISSGKVTHLSNLGSQKKMVEKIMMNNVPIAYWVTDTDWSGFVVKDIILDLVTGDLKAFNRFTSKPIDATPYIDQIRQCYE